MSFSTLADGTLGAPWLVLFLESRFGVSVCQPVTFFDDTFGAPWLVLSLESRFGVPSCHMFLDDFVNPDKSVFVFVKQY